MQLYENIKKRRLALSMSQSELAEKTGYADKTSISKIEAGAVDLPQSKIMAFAKALHTTPSYLMGWEEKENTPTLTIEDERTIEFIDLFTRLTESEQDFLLAQIKGVLASR